MAKPGPLCSSIKKGALREGRGDGGRQGRLDILGSRTVDDGLSRCELDAECASRRGRGGDLRRAGSAEIVGTGANEGQRAQYTRNLIAMRSERLLIRRAQDYGYFSLIGFFYSICALSRREGILS
jgi:hypothetical protein